jgi:ubiquinone/menaquinone biosynthesis C-methylase UbiE
MNNKEPAAYAVAQFRDAGAEIARLAQQARVVADLEEAVFRSLGFPEEGRVLDVGCGPGFVAGRLQESRPRLQIIGVDRDPDVLSHARSRIEAVQAEAEHLPFAAQEFSCVYARLVLRHLARPDDALAEMFRVLTPDGVVIALDSDDGALVLHPPPAGFSDVLGARQQTARRRGADPFIGRRLPALLRQAGFTEARARALAIDSITLGSAACARIVLSPVTDGIDADLISTEALAAAVAALTMWAEDADSFGMTTALAIGARKPAS